MHVKGISACGAYVPSLRMRRKAVALAHSWALPALRGLGKGTRAFCSEDEDAITIAVESLRAGTSALINALQNSSDQTSYVVAYDCRLAKPGSVQQMHYGAQDQVTGFNGGECGNCGAIQFPILSTCVKCGSTEPMARNPLADEAAKVATYSTDNLQYYPAPPMY